jgi:hypothetical protein
VRSKLEKIPHSSALSYDGANTPHLFNLFIFGMEGISAVSTANVTRELLFGSLARPIGRRSGFNGILLRQTINSRDEKKMGKFVWFIL